MNRTFLVVLVAALAFLGIADSWYLYQSAVTDTALACDIGAGLDGCNIVAQSPYSRFLGQPLALYGIIFFGLVFLTSLALTVWDTRRLYTVLLGFSVLGALLSAVFLFIQFVLIQALCVYCIASAGLAFLILILAFEFWKRRPRLISV